MTASTNGQKIIVVDDEQDLVNVVEIYLKKWKFAVDSFYQSCRRNYAVQK
jgi:DNA-binding response OmpR family regulator